VLQSEASPLTGVGRGVFLYFEFCLASSLDKIENQAKSASIKGDASGCNIFNFTQYDNYLHPGLVDNNVTTYLSALDF
jgi:hypothetical protein